MDNNLVWIIDDDESIRWVLEKGFTENGLRVETFDSAHKALKNLDKDSPKAILTDIKMPGTSGLDHQDQVKDIGLKTLTREHLAYKELKEGNDDESN